MIGRSSPLAPALAATVAGAAVLSAGASALAWEHNIAVWPADRFPLPILMQPGGSRDTDEATMADIVQSTLEEWNRVPCSYSVLEWAGISDTPIVVDDTQVLGWESDDEAWIYGPQAAGATIIDVLGPDGPRIDIAFNDVYFDWVVDANTVVMPDYVFGEDPPLEIDPASVVTHEVGHLLGLAHPFPSIPTSQPDPLATMVFSLLPNAQQKTLAGDDKAGLCAKYFQPGDECTGDSDCRDGEFCRDYTIADQVVRLCDEQRGTWGDDCGIDHYHCQGTCLFTSIDLRQGFCTSLCETGADCPTEPERWDCEELPTTTEEPVLACMPHVESEEADEADRDTGIGLVDRHREEDTEPTDVSPEEAELASAEVPIDASPADAGGGTEAEGAGSDAGCCSTAEGRAPSGAALAALAGFALIRRRQR